MGRVSNNATDHEYSHVGALIWVIDLALIKRSVTFMRCRAFIVGCGQQLCGRAVLV